MTIRIINCKSTPFLAFVQYHNNGIYLFLLTVIGQHGLQIEGLGYDYFGGRRHAVVVTGSNAWLVHKLDFTGQPLQETRASVEQSSCDDFQEQSDRWERSVSQHWAGRA